MSGGEPNSARGETKLPAAITVPFNSLSKETRERLVGVVKEGREPSPIFRTESEGMAGIAGSIIFAAMGGVAVAILWESDFGMVNASFIQGKGPLVAYSLLFLIAIGAALSGFRRILRRRGNAMPPGRYVFPFEIVDATRLPDLKVHSLAYLDKVDITNRYQNNVYQGTDVAFRFGYSHAEVFTVAGQDRVRAGLNKMDALRASAREALAKGDMAAVREADPLFGVREEGGWETLLDKLLPPIEHIKGPKCAESPGWLDKRWYIAAIFALVLGPGVSHARNYLSDAAAFRDAKVRGDVASYQAYLAQGSRFVHPVKSDLLPRAAFAAIPSPKRAGHLRTFLKSYPNSPLDREARESIHTAFQESLKNYSAEAPKGGDVLPFMERLLAHLEAGDSPFVEVRFASPDSTALEGVDRAVAANHSSLDVAPVAPHFDEAKNGGREGAIVTALVTSFQKVFPLDILDLRQVQGHGALPGPKELKTPAILVKYTVSPTDSIYSSRSSAFDPFGELRRTHAYVGIRVSFAVNMLIPGDERPLSFNLVVVPPDEFRVSYKTTRLGSLPAFGSSEGPSDSAVYDTMALRAFDQMTDKLLKVFFGSHSKILKESEAPN